jgi:rod shape-determining protein MreC
MESRRFRRGSLAVVTRYRSLILLAAVLFGQLLVMAYQMRRQQDVPLVRGAVVYVVAPVQKGLAAAVGAVRGVWEGYVYLWGTRRQNQVLSSEIDRLKLENQRLRTQAEQGRRLQELFEIRQQLPLPTLSAQVLSAGSSEAARIVLIDKGASHGLKPDLPVLVPDGVVGKVLHVFSTTAQVLLLTDSYSGVASLLEDSRVHGVVKGQNRSECILAYVPNGEEVRPGQVVYTSGEDQVFPKGLPVGVVLESRPGLEFQQIMVRPLARLNRLEEVLVILQSGGDIGQVPLAHQSPLAPHESGAADAEKAEPGDAVDGAAATSSPARLPDRAQPARSQSGPTELVSPAPIPTQPPVLSPPQNSSPVEEPRDAEPPSPLDVAD